MTSAKPSEVHLFVSAIMPDGEILDVGRILSKNLRFPERLQGYFRYTPKYLTHPKAYALDPMHLPLVETTFKAHAPITGIHDVFEDSLPDAWGRQLLARREDSLTSRSFPILLLRSLRHHGLGRLCYSETENFRPVAEYSSIPFADVLFALEEATKLESIPNLATVELQHLIACGSSAGGARPKILVEKDGAEYLAKFSSVFDVPPRLFGTLEFAGMELARQVGLTVPETQMHVVAERSLLLVRRFDVTNAGGRNAIISFKTLLGTEDAYTVSYSSIAKILREVSHQPTQDLENLFQQMVLNVLLRNTDDHLKNFSLLHTAAGYELSPVYDLLPNLYQTTQILAINGKHNSRLSREDLLEEGLLFGLSLKQSTELLNKTVALSRNWAEVFKTVSVPEQPTAALRRDILQRFERLEKTPKLKRVLSKKH